MFIIYVTHDNNHVSFFIISRFLTLLWYLSITYYINYFEENRTSASLANKRKRYFIAE